MDSKFYEKDFIPTSIEEIDYIRSPMYDLAKAVYMDEEEVHELLEDFGIKTGMMDGITQSVLSAKASPENAAFFRY